MVLLDVSGHLLDDETEWYPLRTHHEAYQRLNVSVTQPNIVCDCVLCLCDRRTADLVCQLSGVVQNYLAIESSTPTKDSKYLHSLNC